MNTVAVQKIENAVRVGLTCVEQRLVNKGAVRRQLMEVVMQQMQPARTVADLPIEVLELLHDELGIGFEANDGQISGLCIQTSLGDQITICIPVPTKGA